MNIRGRGCAYAAIALCALGYVVAITPEYVEYEKESPRMTTHRDQTNARGTST